MFASPPTSTLEWSDESVEGSYRFLKRVWDLALKFSKAKRSANVDRRIRYQIHLGAEEGERRHRSARSSTPSPPPA